MKFQNLILAVVIIATLGLIGYSFLNSLPSEQNRPTNKNQPAMDDTNQDDAPAEQTEWLTYQSPDNSPIQFRLRHPEAVNTSQVNSDIYEIKFIGPGSEPNTEITDGYSMSLQFVSATSLTGYIEEQNPLSRARDTSHNSYASKNYQTASELGDLEVKHKTINLSGAGYLADVTWSISGPRTAEYEVEVQQIIDSIEFETNDASGASIISIDSPVSGETVASPITVSGEARGYWFFEATASLMVTDWDGRIIGESFITADGDWMTEDFVPFSGTVEYSLPTDVYSASGTIIFQKANPSGLPENDDAREVSVILEPNTQ